MPTESKPPPYVAALTTVAPEIRLAIYDYLFIMGDVFVRWNDRAARYDLRFTDIFDRDIEERMYKWRPLRDDRAARTTERARGVWFWDNRWKLHKPQTQLFLVCKLVSDEAMHHYLTKNSFHIMGTDCGIPYLNWGLHPPRDTHIRRLTVAFDHRAVDVADCMAKYIDEKQKWLARTQSQAQAQSQASSSALIYHPSEEDSLWRRHVHDELLWELQNTAWLPLVCGIHQLVLKHLEVNVQNCYCPCGCQRDVEWAIGWLCEWESEPPEVFIVSGTRSEEERDEIRRLAGRSVRMGMQLVFGRSLDG